MRKVITNPYHRGLLLTHISTYMYENILFSYQRQIIESLIGYHNILPGIRDVPFTMTCDKSNKHTFRGNDEFLVGSVAAVSIFVTCVVCDMGENLLVDHTAPYFCVACWLIPMVKPCHWHLAWGTSRVIKYFYQLPIIRIQCNRSVY